MKFVCVFVAVLCLSQAAEVKNESECKCWEDYQPEKTETGAYFCRGEKTSRIYQCGEEKPPICKCQVKGKIVEMDLGVTDCLSVDLQTGRYCYNKDDFINYFLKHPEHATYD